MSRCIGVSRFSFSFGRLSRLNLLLLFVSGTVWLSLSANAQAQSAQYMAQVKSQRMANLGFNRLRLPYKSPYSRAPVGMRHVWPLQQPYNARGEGVGYSPYSARQAVLNSSYYGRRPIVARAVVRGRDGYYATVYYR